MGTKTKNGLFYFFMLVLSMPMLQHTLPFSESGPLHGGYETAKDTVFTVESWWQGRYQQKKEKYLNDETGFRPDLVRFTCQLDFSLFGKCHAGWDIKGGNGHLFQWPYVNAYYGIDYRGYEHLSTRARKLKAIQDTFTKMGKTLLVMYAPSKVTSYHEYLPYTHIRSAMLPTNHDTYVRLGDSLGINQVDIDQWFLAMKHTSKEPLFSKQGIHWTDYGAVLASDSLVRYIESHRNIKLYPPRWDSVEHTTDLRNGDNDLAVDLNLIFPYIKETMAYPVLYDPVPDSTRKKINIILLGDSFAQKLIYSGVISKISRQCEYWGYNKDAHDILTDAYAMMDAYDWKAALNKCDVFVLCYTTFNLQDMGQGFIENAFSHYYPNGYGALK